MPHYYCRRARAGALRCLLPSIPADGFFPAPLVMDMHGYSSNEEEQAFIPAFTQKWNQEGLTQTATVFGLFF